MAARNQGSGSTIVGIVCVWIIKTTRTRPAFSGEFEGLARVSRLLQKASDILCGCVRSLNNRDCRKASEAGRGTLGTEPASSRRRVQRNVPADRQVTRWGSAAASGHLGPWTRMGLRQIRCATSAAIAARCDGAHPARGAVVRLGCSSHRRPSRTSGQQRYRRNSDGQEIELMRAWYAADMSGSKN